MLLDRNGGVPRRASRSRPGYLFCFCRVRQECVIFGFGFTTGLTGDSLGRTEGGLGDVGGDNAGLSIRSLCPRLGSFSPSVLGGHHAFTARWAAQGLLGWYGIVRLARDCSAGTWWAGWWGVGPGEVSCNASAVWSGRYPSVNYSYFK